MKRIALLAAVAMLVVPQTFASPWLKSLSAAQKQAKTDNSLIFVDLFADWCGWCHQLEQQVFPSETFQKATKDHVMLRLNTEDNGDGTKLAREYQVTSLPTSVLLTSDLQVVGFIKGFLPADKMSEAIKDLETKYTDFQKRIANEDAIATDYTKRLELAREFRAHHAYPQSITRFKKLVSEPKAPSSIRDQAYFDLAVTQAMTNKTDDAMKTIADFGKVATSGDPYERAQILSAEIYYQQGNFMAAATQLRTFKQKFPKSPLMPQVDMLLTNLQQRMSASRVQ